MCHM